MAKLASPVVPSRTLMTSARVRSARAPAPTLSGLSPLVSDKPPSVTALTRGDYAMLWLYAKAQSVPDSAPEPASPAQATVEVCLYLVVCACELVRISIVVWMCGPLCVRVCRPP